MMETVWKFKVALEDITTVEIPAGAKILHIAEQHGRACMWVHLDTELPFVERRFRVAGTGHTLHNGIDSWEDLKHVGSFVMLGGDLVFHVFEILDVG